MASLWFAGPVIKNDFIYSHCDIVYDASLLAMLMDDGRENVLLVEKKECGEEGNEGTGQGWASGCFQQGYFLKMKRPGSVDVTRSPGSTEWPSVPALEYQQKDS